MRPVERIEPMVAYLRAAWYANPDWRLGQLVCNASSYRALMQRDPFYIEDVPLLEGLRAVCGGERPPKPALCDVCGFDGVSLRYHCRECLRRYVLGRDEPRTGI